MRYVTPGFESYNLPHGRDFCPRLALATSQRPFGGHLPTVRYTVRCGRVKHLGQHFIYLFVNHDNDSLDTKTKKKNPVLRTFMAPCDQITEIAAHCFVAVMFK